MPMPQIAAPAPTAPTAPSAVRAVRARCRLRALGCSRCALVVDQDRRVAVHDVPARGLVPVALPLRPDARLLGARRRAGRCRSRRTAGSLIASSELRPATSGDRDALAVAGVDRDGGSARDLARAGVLRGDDAFGRRWSRRARRRSPSKPASSSVLLASSIDMPTTFGRSVQHLTRQAPVGLRELVAAVDGVRGALRSRVRSCSAAG